MVAVQASIALLVIVAGAHLFVTEVEFFSADVLNVPAAVIALLLAPLATELPGKFNSVIWIAEGKDTLAIGDITGAMVVRGTIPAALGILFTSWDLGVAWGAIGFLNALSAALALLGGGMVLLRTRFVSANELRPAPFLVAGLLTPSSSPWSSTTSWSSASPQSVTEGRLSPPLRRTRSHPSGLSEERSGRTPRE